MLFAILARSGIAVGNPWPSWACQADFWRPLLIVELLELGHADIALGRSRSPGWRSGALNFGFVRARLSRLLGLRNGFRGEIEAGLSDRTTQLGNAQRLDILVQEVDTHSGIKPPERLLRLGIALEQPQF